MSEIPTIDLAWESVNALGGTASTPIEEAYVDAISKALDAIEKLGGKDPLPERHRAAVVACINGKCDCRNATACKFARCKNCDNPIDAQGKTVIDHCCEVEKLQVCPDCDGPLNERLVYGAL